jgi:hypothetical protein
VAGSGVAADAVAKLTFVYGTARDSEERTNIASVQRRGDKRFG